MDSQIILGLVAFGIAVVAGLIAYFAPIRALKSENDALSVEERLFQRRVALKSDVMSAEEKRIHRHVALMTFASWIAVGSLVPQLIRNGELGEKLEESVSPFFPALYPLIVLAKFPAESDLIKLARSKNNTYGLTTLVVTQYFLLIGFIVWVFQFAQFSSSMTIQVVFYSLGVLYSFCVLAISRWVYLLLKDTNVKESGWAEEIELEPLNSTSPEEVSDLM